MSQLTQTSYPENSLLATEIAQQPRLWLDTLERVQAFLPGRHFRNKPAVLTGAGTSAYAGQAIAGAWPGARAMATTDLMLFSEKEMETAAPGFADGGILISLARSGDSPESVGVVRRMQAMFPAVGHLAITCNADGKLARLEGVDVLALSPETNDRSLAMTASFSNLTLAGMLILNHDEIAPHLPAICRNVAERVADMYGVAQAVAAQASERFVVLASGMQGLAVEAALKTLELTGGERLGIAESFLGLRHGPASALRQNTPVLCFTSNDPHKLRYEEDFVREFCNRGLGKFALIGRNSVQSWPHDWFVPSVAPMLPDHLRIPFEIVFAQLFAYASSLQSGVDPDDPSPDGQVTRIVKPFQLHS
ncbi:SIS domain-containing protein [Terriglobus sp.]|uniref:SIS domain-containing protein n=1 Tax=Terriglobus sp. TaxID=1889013 RepID=UPI003AFFE3DA